MKVKSAVAALAAAVLLAGCASTVISLSSSNSPSLGMPAPGVSYSAVSINADVTPAAILGFVLLGYLVAGMQNDYRYGSGSASSREAPDLAGDRAIAERDCREPLGLLYANLRCK